MKKIMKRLLVCSILLTFFVSLLPNDTNAMNSRVQASENSDSSTDEAFTDIGANKITGEMSPGWNLGNQLESLDAKGIPGETKWGNPIITEKLIKTVKAAGFKSIRIPVSYLGLIGKGPDYTIDKAWLDRIQEVVDYVVKNDMYAVINIHGDGFQSITGGWLFCNDKDQVTIKAKLQAVWQQIATRFKDYDEHLIFETMNEVSDFSYGNPKPEFYKNINDYNQIALDTIRKTGGNNNMRWVLMPGWNTNIDHTANASWGFVIPKDNYLSDKITGKSRIMISVHYYTPDAFCLDQNGKITQWGDKVKKKNKALKEYGPSYMKEQFKLLRDSFTAKGYPVVIGEYGAVDKAADDKNNTYYRAVYCKKLNEYSLKYGCVPMYWDNGYNTKYGFALFDRTKCKVTQQSIIDAIMSVYK